MNCLSISDRAERKPGEDAGLNPRIAKRKMARPPLATGYVIVEESLFLYAAAQFRGSMFRPKNR
jgi:hypothetical protein